MRWDVIVAGAGAAGLLAAIRAAERGRRTLLLEKNRRPGAKILMSGGTRCNITHNTDARGIVDAYGLQGCFLYSSLAALSPADVVALFEAEGVATKVEETGKVFPESDRATDVLAALLQRLGRSGCELRQGIEADLASEAASDGKKQLLGMLLRIIPRRLAEALLEQAGVRAELKAAELSKPLRRRLVDAIKRTRIPISGTRGFKKAEVTAGGVSLGEVDSSTMESKLVSHLFLAGEVLDLDGPIGGFNFQAAFSTAWLAGSKV